MEKIFYNYLSKKVVATNKPDVSGSIRTSVKTVSYRLFASMDTFLLSTLVTGDISDAASIGTTELATKPAIYFLHERLWSKYQPSNPAIRNIVKSFSWRTVATADTMLLSWMYTGKVEEALGIAVAETFTKLPIYSAHEYIWSKIKWNPSSFQFFGNRQVTDFNREPYLYANRVYDALLIK